MSTVSSSSSTTRRFGFGTPTRNGEKSKRRTFAFLTAGKSPDRRRGSSSALRRTREHAKQLALTMATPSPQPQQRLKPPVVDTFSSPPLTTIASAESPTESMDSRSMRSNNSIGAYDMDIVRRNVDPRKPQRQRSSSKTSLDMFVEKQQRRKPRGGSASVASESSTLSKSSSISIASNSSITQQQRPHPVGGQASSHDLPVNRASTFPSNSTMNAKNLSGSAARRRARRQHGGSDNGSSVAALSTASSYVGLEPEAPLGDPTTTPESPYAFKAVRLSNSSQNSSSRSSVGSSERNRLKNYQPRQSPLLMDSSFGSTRELFSLEDDANGFTFDAFGLDANQVDMEVSAAIQAMEDHASDFFTNDEFPDVSFDSPNPSRAHTPDSFLDQDGFQDGFRIAGGAIPHQLRNSPSSSQNSSLTESTGSSRRNMWKEQAGFAAGSVGESAGGETMSSSGSSPERRISPDKVPQQWADFGAYNSNARKAQNVATTSSFDSVREAPDIPNLYSTSSFSPPKKPQHMQQEPVEWDQEGDGGNGSDIGFFTRSDTGAPSSSGIPSDVGVASDIGVMVSHPHVWQDAADLPDLGDLPMEISPKKKKRKSPKSSPIATQTKSSMVEDREETKDEGLRAEVAGEVCAAQSVSSLKNQWERQPQQLTEQEPERPSSRQRPRTPVNEGNIRKFSNHPRNDSPLQNQTTPVNQKSPITSARRNLRKMEKDGPTESQKRAEECANQRGSFSSNKARLKAANLRDVSTSSKSEVGSWRSAQSAKALLGRMEVDSKSDIGGSTSKPAWAAVKLRTAGPSKLRFGAVSPFLSDQTGSDNDWPDLDDRDNEVVKDDIPEDDSPQIGIGESAMGNVPYQESRHLGWAQDSIDVRKEQKEIIQAMHAPDEEEEPRKLTYRERREKELQEEKARQAAEEGAKRKPQERDVAAMIKRRIAANKAKANMARGVNTAPTSGGTKSGNSITDARSRLKKVSLESKLTQLQSTSSPSRLVRRERDVSSSFGERRTPTAASVRETSSQPAPRDAAESLSATKSAHATEPSAVLSTPEAAAPSVNRKAAETPSSEHVATPQKRPSASASVANLFASKAAAIETEAPATAEPKQESFMTPPASRNEADSISATSAATKHNLNAFFANRNSSGPRLDFDGGNDDASALMKSKQQKASSSAHKALFPEVAPPVDVVAKDEDREPSPAQRSADGRPALKEDPKYDRYFRMLKVGMPLEVVKHAMSRDGIDPSVIDGDHDKPAGYGDGVPLKDDPKYEKYFKMLKIGLPMGAVKNALERDGLDPSVMDGDHNLPVNTGGRTPGPSKPLPKDTHRRTRLHWDTLRKVRANSLWAKIDDDKELMEIDIDEEEFQQLFQAEITPAEAKTTSNVVKRGAAVRVIDSKRANNGGIILARLKMTHDEMADAVDRIDDGAITAEQMQNIIEYLPSSEERKALENYMLSGGMDAAEKFDGLCECEKFMVAMMTVKHAKRKVKALLFKLQFASCLESLESDASLVETSCDELSNSIRLRKLLGIVLNVGNRLNTAGVSGKRKAGAFKLESLLKLSHAKAFDKKTTFLHYIVLVLQRNNELLLRFMDDLPHVMKSDRVYWDQCVADLEEVENQLENVRRIALHQARLAQMFRLKKVKQAMENDDDDGDSMSDCSMSLEEEVSALRATSIGMFTLNAIKKVSALRDQVERTKFKFTKLLEYFGEDNQEMQPHELFNIMVTFCRDFDKAKEVVYAGMKKKLREDRKKNMAGKTTANARNPAPKPMPKVPLRASNHQPNMSAIFKFRAEPPILAQPQTPVMRNGAQPAPQRQQRSPRTSDANSKSGTQVTSTTSSSIGCEDESKRVAPWKEATRSSYAYPATGKSSGGPASTSEDVISRGDATTPPRPSAQQMSAMRSADKAVSTMRHKARLRRQRMQAAAGSSAASTTSQTTKSTVSSATHASPQQPSGASCEQKDKLSPRSSIRQRRRMERVEQARRARKLAQQQAANASSQEIQ